MLVGPEAKVPPQVSSAIYPWVWQLYRGFLRIWLGHPLFRWRRFHSTPESRERELASLRLRFLAAETSEVSAYGRELALELRGLRSELARAFDCVQSCSTCGKGQTHPFGAYPGGACCGATTETLFSDLEIESLRAAGTSWRDLPDLRSPHVGCAFRLPSGCALKIEHRPNICVRYLCHRLRAELQLRSDWEACKVLLDASRRTYDAFCAEVRPQS